MKTGDWKACKGCRNWKLKGDEVPCSVCSRGFLDQWKPAESPRWRAEEGKPYWYISNKRNEICLDIYTYLVLHNGRYENGNYYPSLEAAARAYLEKLEAAK